MLTTCVSMQVWICNLFLVMQAKRFPLWLQNKLIEGTFVNETNTGTVTQSITRPRLAYSIIIIPFKCIFHLAQNENNSELMKCLLQDNIFLCRPNFADCFRVPLHLRFPTSPLRMFFKVTSANDGTLYSTERPGETWAASCLKGCSPPTHKPQSLRAR